MASEMSLRLYGRPLVVRDSGGKESTVFQKIVRRSGIPFEIHHNLTTADAPQTIYYVQDIFRKLELQGITCCVNYPIYKRKGGRRVTMWMLIPMKKFSPTRLQRYCCQILKENSCRDRFITTGVRWAESVKRKNNRGVFENFVSDPSNKIILNNDNDENRRLFENCEIKGKQICNLIVDWLDRDVWEYIRNERLEINPLYEMGFYRVDYLECPMAGKNWRTKFRLFSTYQRAYMRAFGKLLDVIHAEGIQTNWRTCFSGGWKRRW